MKSADRVAAADRGGRSSWLQLVMGIAFAVFATNVVAQAPAAPAGAAPPLSSEELAKLVGPIALYPDDLVAIVLPASTNPIQLVQADRYLEKRKADPKLAIDDKWDDPVKSLLNYPDVVKMMSADLDWTTALGEAVVADQGAVIEAVQAFRRKTQAAGNLKSDGKQVVKVEKEIVIIEPADPQVIYVPQYNPTTVIVQSAAPVYAYYPTPYPSYYYPYPPGAAMAAGVDLGGGNRGGVERQSLWLLLERQHQRQPHDQHQHRETSTPGTSTALPERGRRRAVPARGNPISSRGKSAAPSARQRRPRERAMRARGRAPMAHLPVERPAHQRKRRAAQRPAPMARAAVARATRSVATVRDDRHRWTARAAHRVAVPCRAPGPAQALGRRRVPEAHVRRPRAVERAQAAAVGVEAAAVDESTTAPAQTLPSIESEPTT